MREIKFRGYNPATQQIVSWEGMQGWTMGGLESPNIMQYTGLKDKNGKEIYEGDVVRIPDDYEEYGFMAGEQREVYYFDGCFRLKPKKENTRDRGNTIMDDMEKCEVIGNIYENPELLNPHTIIN